MKYKIGYYDLFKKDPVNKTGSLFGRLKIVEDCCHKIMNLKVYNIYGLKPQEYYVKFSKEQKELINE